MTPPSDFDPCGLTPGGCAACPLATSGECIPLPAADDDPDPMTADEAAHAADVNEAFAGDAREAYAQGLQAAAEREAFRQKLASIRFGSVK